MEPIVEVTQADREAAAAIIRWQRNATKEWKAQDGDEAWQFFHESFTRAIMQGIWDQHDIVQSYARHRLSTPSSDLKADNAALVKALKQAADNLAAAAKLYDCPGAHAADRLARDAIATNQHRSADHGN